MAARKSAPKAASRQGLLPWLGIAFIVILLDQFTKVLIVGWLQHGESREVWSFFNIVRAHNTGAAFSFLANAGGWQRWFFVGLGAVATGFIVYMLKQHGGQRLFSWALTLILGGRWATSSTVSCTAMSLISWISTGASSPRCSRAGISPPSTSRTAPSRRGLRC